MKLNFKDVLDMYNFKNVLQFLDKPPAVYEDNNENAPLNIRNIGYHAFRINISLYERGNITVQ